MPIFSKFLRSLMLIGCTSFLLLASASAVDARMSVAECEFQQTLKHWSNAQEWACEQGGGGPGPDEGGSNTAGSGPRAMQCLGQCKADCVHSTKSTCLGNCVHSCLKQK
jgi:hypothetical protein